VRRLVASWFGTGLLLGRLRGSDAGSGTVGAAAALVVGLALAPLGWWAQLAAAAAATVAGLWAAAPFTRDDPGSAPGVAVKEGDPSWVVVDEAAGALLAIVGLTAWPALAAWVVFRAADIFKGSFPGVAAAERLPGAAGVMADDLVAGCYGLAAGWLLSVVL
jgi:phosphatidylglycerophosphatase A